MNRHYKTLELDKILQRLSDLTVLDTARDKALKLEPVFELDKVNKRLKQTDDALMLSGRFGSPSFGGAVSCAGSLRRAQAGGCLSTSELLKIARTLHVIRTVKEWHSKFASVENSLDIYFSGLVSNKFLEDKITTAIISEDEISDKASPALSDIRRKIRTASSKAREVLDKIIHSSSYVKYLQEAIVTQRDGRYVVPVRSECRNNVPGLVHDTSSSGQTVFIEPMGVVQANNDIKLLKGKEEDEIERILFELSVSAGDYADAIIKSYDNLCTLNLIFAKAEFAYRMRASMPVMNDRGKINLKQARHPLIEKEKVVPIDVNLGNEFDTLVITGPNTGGKTVTLKTIGLLTLMAMCGLLVPCADNSELSVFRRVLVDIGDEQSIEQSLSTFSAHMTNIVQIIKLANAGSLCLIDELGAGTDPVEGAALAIAILEKLRSKGAKIASTTHYAELKEFALRTDGVENGCCEFDVATLKPTYRLLIGVPGKSNAFAISRRLGLGEDVVERANELVSTESRQFEDVVEKLEKRRQGLEKQLENANRLTAKANTEKQKAENELRKAKLDAEREIERAKQEAQRIVSSTRARADALVEELEKARREKELSAEQRSKLRRDINQMEAGADPIKLKNIPDEEYKLPRPLKVGDEVLIYDIDKNATVLAPPNKDGVVLVQAGIIKTRVDIKNLRLLKSKVKPPAAKLTTTRSMPSRMDARPETEVDVRGLTAFEATGVVDKAIDNAVLSGINKLTIIHGKGTGVLRREINRFLRSNKAVKSQRLGTFGEGEDGVTIVELR
ncbi:endonuclease MutS2 [Ruminococcus sp. JL13D9]|uniref:endonuclease MutS2 n=1 Tax=Ruminococcus sp. JL13D9 TaxID=3233381 RepID=UPI003899A66C